MHYIRDNFANINNAHRIIEEDTVFDSSFMYFKTFEELKTWLFNKELANLKEKYNL